VENPLTGDLLDRADAERRAGRGPAAARLYDRAVDLCRSDGDLAGWTRAVLGAASVYVFGTQPGRLPAQLYDVLMRTTEVDDRARVAAALARCWVYAGHAARAVPFADDAVRWAGQCSAPDLLVDCLDAALAARWGPDDLDARVRLAAELDDAAAHVLDPLVRLQAHLWGLQTACESLDVPAIHRHMRALELLGEESPRARFFAASRRLMLDLLRGRTDTSASLISMASAACDEAGLADGWMVVEAMKGYTAVQTGDPSTCATIAAECETFGVAEGVAVVCAEAAFLWLHAGRPDRARTLLHAFSEGVLEELPRDVNWLLILQCVLEVALEVGDRAIVATASTLIAPYRGRAVFNAGAVMFHGLTDDTLARATALLGDPETAVAYRAAALSSYERIGAAWWRDRLAAWTPPATGTPSRTEPRTRMHPTADGLWLVGPEDHAVPVRALRGFSYLRELLRRPGQDVSALDLVTSGQGTVVQSSLDATVDRQALDAYRRRLADIDHELDEAGEWSDLGRLGTLEADRIALIEEITAATGLAGRTRPVGSSHERARVAATKAIHSAVDRITVVEAPLARYLQLTVRTGLFCSYTPPSDDPRQWILD
jgi:hypothetical protein